MHPTQSLLPLDGEPLATPPPSARMSPPPAGAEAGAVECPENPPTLSGGSETAATQLPLLLTVRDVEAELQLGRTRVYELVRSGELPVVRLGRVVRVPRDAWSAGSRRIPPTRGVAEVREVRQSGIGGPQKRAPPMPVANTRSYASITVDGRGGHPCCPSKAAPATGGCRGLRSVFFFVWIVSR